MWICPLCNAPFKYFELLENLETTKESLAVHLFLNHRAIMTKEGNG